MVGDLEVVEVIPAIDSVIMCRFEAGGWYGVERMREMVERGEGEGRDCVRRGRMEG